LLTWNHPISFNGILHDYKIRYKLASDSRYDISFSAGGRPFYVVSSLSPFTAYDFQVLASTNGGALLGNWSLTVRSSTKEGVPTVPLNLSANATSATSIKLVWNAPMLLNGALHDYKIRYKLLSDKNFSSPITAAKQLTYSIVGLTPFTDYDFQVQATTNSGLNVGLWSSSIQRKTFEGASTAPLNVSATAISATSIRLTWNQPTSFNGILHEYSIRYKPSSHSTYGTSISAGMQVDYTVNGLKPFTSYQLQVQANTNSGLILGVWSLSVASKTLEGASTAPINASATVISETSILLTWNHPISLNGILHDYKIRYKLTSNSEYGSSFSAGDRPFYIINNLRSFTEYDFQVLASTNGGALSSNWSIAVRSSKKEGGMYRDFQRFLFLLWLVMLLSTSLAHLKLLHQASY